MDGTTLTSPSDIERVAAAGAKLWHRLAEYFLLNEYAEMDSYTFMEIAEEAGLIRHEPYDPARHPELDDVDPGDTAWFYTELGASMTTAWLDKMVGGDAT